MKNLSPPNIKFYPDESIFVDFRGFKKNDLIPPKIFRAMRQTADELLYPIGKLQKLSKKSSTSYDVYDIINRNPTWTFESLETKYSYHLKRIS